MLSWLITIGGLLGSWHYTDIDSESTLQNTVLPIFIGIFLIALFNKLNSLFGGSGGGSGDGGGSFFGGDGGGGDGGGD